MCMVESYGKEWCEDILWPKDMSYVMQDVIRVLTFFALLHGDVTITFVDLPLKKRGDGN
jgi:hypothetical protein